jgi:hypothetical protein
MSRPPLVRPLGEALLSVATWSRDAELYLPVGGNWPVDCPCIVLEDDRYTGVDPRITHGDVEFAYALQQEQVLAIVQNGRASLGRDPTAEEAWRAFLLSHANDTHRGAGHRP